MGYQQPSLEQRKAQRLFRKEVAISIAKECAPYRRKYSLNYIEIYRSSLENWYV